MVTALLPCPGLMEMVPTLLCVATLFGKELELKQHFPNYPVLLMGLTRSEYFDDVLQYHLIQTIDTFEQAAALSQSAAKHRQTAHIHIKIDTGFHRLGFLVNEESINQIEAIAHLPHILIDGIFTHLVLLDDTTNERQFQLFLSVREALEKRKIHIPCWHIADSIAGVDYPQYRMDGIRAGAILYGLKGFHKRELDILQAIFLKTAGLTIISPVGPGKGSATNFNLEGRKRHRIATLPLAYGDVIRKPSGKRLG